MVSPNNKRFTFLHRWRTDDDGIYARLYTASTNGGDLYLLNDSGRMSHYCWKNDDEVFGWGGVSNHINSLRKYKSIVKFLIKPLLPIYHKIAGSQPFVRNMVTNDSYLLFYDKSTKVKRIDTAVLSKDGHPSFSSKRDYMLLSDTYPNPDDNYKEELFLFNVNTNQMMCKLKLSHPKEFADSSIRCDLHPKWSHDGEYVCVDTLDKGVRSVYVYQVCAEL